MEEVKETFNTEDAGDRPETNGVASGETKKSGTSALLGPIVLAVIVVLGGAGYYFIQQLRSSQAGLGGELEKGDKQVLELTKQITNLQAQIAAVQTQVNTMESKSANKESSLERKITDFSERHTEKLGLTADKLEKSIRYLNRQFGKTRSDWLVADAEYLISVANQRLHMSGDIKTAMLALEAADERLRESGDAGVFKVREAVAKEISSLKAIKTADIVGTFSKIRALEEKIEKIPVFMPHSGSAVVQKSKEETERDVRDIDSLLGSAVKDLKDLVEVRRTDRPMDVVLKPEEVQMLRQELGLKLELAGLALIQRNEKLYQENLSSSEDWLSKHFDTESDLTQAVITEIGNLKNTSINVDLPDTGRSLKLLRDITRLRLESDRTAIQRNEGQSSKDSSEAGQ